MKAKSEKIREMGKDFILRPDIYPEGEDPENTKSTIPIEILVENFRGTVIMINKITFGEPSDIDDTVGVEIDYTVIKPEGKEKELSTNPEFITVVGDIVTSLLIYAVEKAEEIVNESGENNPNESDKE